MNGSVRVGRTVAILTAVTLTATLFAPVVGQEPAAAAGPWRAKPAQVKSVPVTAVGHRDTFKAGPGAKAPRRTAGVKGARVKWLANPGIEVSSSAVRERSGANRSVRYLVPDAVARLIARHGLYRSAT